MKKEQKTTNAPLLPDGRFAIARKNAIWILLGLAIMILGYVLMTGGGTDDPSKFTGEQMFSFRRIVLAPALIFIGFVFEIWAIMHKKKDA